MRAALVGRKIAYTGIKSCEDFIQSEAQSLQCSFLVIGYSWNFQNSWMLSRFVKISGLLKYNNPFTDLQNCSFSYIANKYSHGTVCLFNISVATTKHSSLLLFETGIRGICITVKDMTDWLLPQRAKVTNINLGFRWTRNYRH